MIYRFYIYLFLHKYIFSHQGEWSVWSTRHAWGRRERYI